MLEVLFLSDCTIKEPCSASSPNVPSMSFGFPFSMASANDSIMSTVAVIYTPLWFGHCTRHAAQRSFYIQPSSLAFCRKAPEPVCSPPQSSAASLPHVRAAPPPKTAIDPTPTLLSGPHSAITSSEKAFSLDKAMTSRREKERKPVDFESPQDQV